MNGLLATLSILLGLFCMMMSLYLCLCFIVWVSDVIEEKRWQDWRYWFK